MKLDVDIKISLDPALERKLENHFSRILQNQERIMTAVSDFAVKQDAFNANISAKIDTAVAAAGDIKTEIANLNAEIATLQNSPGTISADDQATLDRLTTAGQAVQDKFTTLSTALTALDTLPPPPPAPTA